ncbi:phosphonate ABC transporter ATP-binding protein, partial [Aduncisulcus paluster]
MKTEPYIKLKNISKKYDGATALFPLNLDISKRERIALIGPSGAGKSTLLNILSGSVTSDTGEYLLKDRLFASMNRKERAEGIGLVRQQFDL